MAGLSYAGIGSRRTPPAVLSYMRRLAVRLAVNGFVLRSGRAQGADQAFESGCLDAGGASEIWVPWRGFGSIAGPELLPSDRHFEAAARLHPAWGRLSQSVRSLHARNVGQVLGDDLQSPVNFVVCWTADGCESHSERTSETGGTGMAISVATSREATIPVFNLARPDATERLHAFVLALLGRGSTKL